MLTATSALSRSVRTFTLDQKRFCWSDFGIRTTAEADRSMPAHRHSFYQIFFVADGTAVHEIFGHTYKVKSGSIFFVPPFAVHRVVFPADAECYVIYFTSRFTQWPPELPNSDANFEEYRLQHLPELAPFRFQSHCIYQLDPAEIVEAQQYCRRMMAASTRRGFYDAIRARSALTLLLVLVAEKYLSEFRDLEKNGNIQNLLDKRARIAIDFLSKNFSRNLSLDEVAAQVHLTGTYLTVLLKQETGKTYKQILDEFRLEYSKQLLAYTELPIMRVAEDSGFLDQVHFTKRFKSYTGTTPGQYRRAHQAAFPVVDADSTSISSSSNF
ncbi:HTH-type transcriptional activator RhaS [Castellaniella defragrans]